MKMMMIVMMMMMMMMVMMLGCVVNANEFPSNMFHKNTHRNTNNNVGYLVLTDNLDMDVEAFVVMAVKNNVDMMVVTGRGVQAANVAQSIMDLTPSHPPLYTMKQPDILESNYLVKFLQGFANIAYFAPLAAPKTPPLPESDIPAAYTEFLQKYPDEIVVISIPEFTPLSKFLDHCVSVGYSGKIRIFAMGGSVVGGTHRGNVNIFTANQNTAAEYNAWADPTAVANVLNHLSSSVTMHLFSLDSTDSFPVTSQFLDELDAIAGTNELTKFLAKFSRNAHGLYQAVSINLYHWDVLPSLAALNLAFQADNAFVPVKLSVETTGAQAGAVFMDQQNGKTVFLCDPFTTANEPVEAVVIDVLKGSAGVSK